VSAAVRELEDAVAIIGNVNIDTMYGFDGESDDALHETLSTFVALGIPCVSIYALDGQRRNREIVRFEPSQDPYYERKIRIFRDARAFLTGQGFEPVLQNIFLQPARASYRHQLRRWNNVTLVALGMSSTGYAPRRIYQNHLSLKNYYAHIDEGKLPILESEEISQEIEIMREAVSQLRFTQVDLARLNEKYGVNLGAVFHDLIEALTELGYLQSEGRVLRLTDKAAPYNNIIPMLFAPDSLKAVIFGLPEEYRENFPLPYVLTQIGATQSAAMNPGGR
jgi:oxygen-independent coproporphyrinogen-3 oxidase